MKYEFHVGDYVETKQGDIGIITEIASNVFWWYCVCGKGPLSKMYEQAFFLRPDVVVESAFNRIGQYDFTKKDEGEIEPLSDNYMESFPIFKTHNTITGKTYKQECYSIDMGVISKKINELVEVVNRLEEKVNEMAQS